MDWIKLLKSQQVDFLQRVKKPKTYDVSLLESPVKGCHSEIVTFWGETLTKLLENARQQAEFLAKTPPPVPPEYPEPPDWTIPFPTYFQQQAEDYLLREQIVERVICDRLGRLVKKLPQETLKNITLDDEGNLGRESKFSYFFAGDRHINIQVNVVDGESFNGIKKNKIRWTITQDDLKNHQIIIFLCSFYPFTGKRGYEKQVVITGFLPTNLLEFNEPKQTVIPSQLLYSGGLNWYLDRFTNNSNEIIDEVMKFEPEITVAETIKTLAPEHSLKYLIGDWEFWQTLRGHSRGINCLAFSPTNSTNTTSQILASASKGETKLWDLAKGELISTFSEYPWSKSQLVDEVNSLAFTPDGQMIVSGGADSTIKLWHVNASDLIDILHKHNGIVRCVACTPDGRMFVTGGDDRTILFWDLTYRTVAFTLSLDDTAARTLALSADGTMLVAGSYRKIQVWRISRDNYRTTTILNTELLHSFTAHSHIVSSLGISQDGKTLVSSSIDKTIKIWNLETGTLLRTLKGHCGEVLAINLSPDGKIIASGSVDTTIKLWHLDTGELLATFTGHTHAVTAVTFTVSGEMLVSASLDKTIKIWQKS
ncbi:MAG: WD40 repeat domain-containing protein [Calothrix sp. CSU_2_0]|nr:WD40 repeat domain-containing protein [Calothrix sp. CSU_2_0]